MTHQYMEIKIKDLEKRIAALEQKKPETVTEFADRCQECGAKYGKLLEDYRQAVEASEVIKKSMECHDRKVCDLAENCEDCPLYVDKDTEYEAHKVLLLLLKQIQTADECLRAVEALEQNKAVKALSEQDVLDKIRAEIEKTTSRYTISRERGAMGQVEWSDRLIKESEVLEIIDKYKAESEEVSNEEAIEFIKTDISRLWDTPQNLEHKEALEKAIKALKQEPCTDAISRQAVFNN